MFVSNHLHFTGIHKLILFVFVGLSHNQKIRFNFQIPGDKTTTTARPTAFAQTEENPIESSESTSSEITQSKSKVLLFLSKPAQGISCICVKNSTIHFSHQY